MAKVQEFRDQSEEELEAALFDLSKELYETRNKQQAKASSVDIHTPRKIRRDVARVKTVLREKQIEKYLIKLAG